MAGRLMNIGMWFAVATASTTVWADPSIHWSTVDGGGGTSAGGAYELIGSLGQPEASAAGAVAGGAYSLTGGFWSVSLRPCTVFAPADFDHNCMVDGVDVGAFIDCASGAAVPLATGCEPMDLDQDGDVDLDDFGLLQRCYSGPSLLASPGCPE